MRYLRKCLLMLCLLAFFGTVWETAGLAARDYKKNSAAKGYTGYTAK